MICLDTNYLIRALTKGSKEGEELVGWYTRGVRLITPAMAWFEFTCGPVTPVQQKAIRAFLHEIRPFTEVEALEAGRLSNGINRKRTLRVDTMIAATALIAKARLATQNRADFAHFVPLGLQLL